MPFIIESQRDHIIRKSNLDLLKYRRNETEEIIHEIGAVILEIDLCQLRVPLFSAQDP